jgi:hypothetical protein
MFQTRECGVGDAYLLDCRCDMALAIATASFELREDWEKENRRREWIGGGREFQYSMLIVI